MIIKQLSIFVENKPGRLANVTRAIGDAGINIRALSVADTSDYGILRLIVSNPHEAVKALKEAEFAVSLTDVIAVGIDDRPGAFADIVVLLGAEGIDIEYMYAFLGRCDRRAYVILRVEDVEHAIHVIRAGGVTLLTKEEVYDM